jgi:hypothetical protein
LIFDISVQEIVLKKNLQTQNRTSQFSKNLGDHIGRETKKFFIIIIIINLIKSLEPHRIPLLLVKYRAVEMKSWVSRHWKK